MRAAYSMVTTQITNGVSFSLVAGAMCVVRFSNRHSSVQVINNTLNINSTGAKTCRGTTQSATSQTDKGFVGMNANCWVFFYNGSQYDFIGDYRRSSYSDSD